MSQKFISYLGVCVKSQFYLTEKNSLSSKETTSIIFLGQYKVHQRLTEIKSLIPESE